MTANKYASRNKPAGILMLVYGAFMIISGVVSLAVGTGLVGLLTLLIAVGQIFWGVTLVIGKRDALPVAGAVVLASLQLISQIIQLVNSYATVIGVLMALLWMSSFVFLVLVMAGGLLPQFGGLKKLARGAWFVPAILVGVNELLSLIVLLVSISRYGRYMSVAEIVGAIVGIVLGTVAWVIAMLFSCQWAALGDGRQQNALPPYQGYQPPQQYQGYQPPQPYQGYQQPQPYQGYQQPQPYQGYQQPQPYQGYQQPQPYQGYQQPQTEQNIDPAVKLRNFQRLLDEGLITQEEFDAKKKQILGL